MCYDAQCSSSVFDAVREDFSEEEVLGRTWSTEEKAEV